MSVSTAEVKFRLHELFSKIRIPKWLLITFLVLLVVRMILPQAILYGMNWTLQHKMGAYTGHLEDFDLSLYRGAYEAQGLVIEKKKGNLPPLLSVGEIDLSIAWRRLVHGQFDGDIVIDHAVVNLLDSSKKENRQTGTEEKSWNSVFEKLFPMTIERFVVQNSAIHFSNPDLIKDQVVKVENIRIVAEDLQSRHDKSEKALSPLKASGLLQDHAPIKINGKIDAVAIPTRADLDFSVVNFKANSINKILLGYLPLDLSKGQISVYGEAATAKDELKGYANVFLKNIKVVAPRQKLLSARHFFIETGTSFANWLLKNEGTEEVAAHIPFSRTQGKFELNAKEAIWSAIKNKDDSLPKGIEHSVNLGSVEGKRKK